MKKINYYVLFFISIFVLISCEKEEIIERVEVPVEVEVEVEIQRISFEGVSLNESGFQNNFPDGLILSDIDLYNHFDATYFSWEGFAVSNNTDKETAGFGNQYSVYNESGANGSEKFAVAFSGYNETTHIQFLSGKEYKFKNLMINNSTYAALAMKNGDAYSKKFENGDWFKIIITGFKTDGSEAGKVEFYLADFRNKNSFICSEWTEVDLTELGEINKLEFTFESTDVGEWGMNTPAFACIDDIVYYVNE